MRKGGRHMDKQNVDHVKIKINGKDRPVSQSNANVEELPVSTWDEKRQAENEVASAKQPIEEEDEFPWLLPEEESIFKEDPKVVTPTKWKNKKHSNQTVTPYIYPKKNKKAISLGFPLKKMVSILFLAVGVGIGFGYIALHLMSNEDMPATATPLTQNQEPSDNASEQAENKEGATKEEAPAASTSSATLEVYAVQGGIFSTNEGATTVRSSIQSKGLASTTLEQNENFTVIAGLGKEKAETDYLNEEYKQEGFTEFWGGKQLTVNIHTSHEPEKWSAILYELSSHAAASIKGKNVGEETLATIENSIKQLHVSEEEKSSREKLLQSVEEIRTKEGWKAQQSLLDVVQSLYK